MRLYQNQISKAVLSKQYAMASGIVKDSLSFDLMPLYFFVI